MKLFKFNLKNDENVEVNANRKAMELLFYNKKLAKEEVEELCKAKLISDGCYNIVARKVRLVRGIVILKYVKKDGDLTISIAKRTLVNKNKEWLKRCSMI